MVLPLLKGEAFSGQSTMDAIIVTSTNSPLVQRHTSIGCPPQGHGISDFLSLNFKNKEDSSDSFNLNSLQSYDLWSNKIRHNDKQDKT